MGVLSDELGYAAIGYVRSRIPVDIVGAELSMLRCGTLRLHRSARILQDRPAHLGEIGWGAMGVMLGPFGSETTATLMGAGLGSVIAPTHPKPCQWRP